ncbi:UNVERIFIED_CONTAM: Retrovirus-related Pol polyprotein from transposon TNT 1-94 [Sesamum angustifolium]|uniref:Retrovirus-related Pol polyprotein from transposon TNT 1-94 n=1 Tax=Sesamum angustifolium TaxID=2727405 RepID=A0AAW2L5Z9_9LAMI
MHKGNNGKIQKNKYQCYCCGKTGHKVYQCYQRKDQQKINQKHNSPQLNLAETKEIIAAVVVEANLVENKMDWILDTGATKHFCANKDLFQEFHEASDGEGVFMGNSATAGVMGKDKHRPDIAYTVSRLSRYTHNPNKEHWDAIHRLLKYLKGGGAISWKSAKQTCIARSTMESEFIALELVGQEAEWLRNLVGNIPLWGSTVAVSLHCDSQAAIGIARTMHTMAKEDTYTSYKVR